MTERQHQIKVVQYLQILEKQKKILTFFSVPNGGSRNALEAKNLKLEGVRAGVSDLVIVFKGKVLFLEMKIAPKKLKSGKLSYTNSKISDKQRDFLTVVNNSDLCFSEVGYGFTDAIDKISKYLKE